MSGASPVTVTVSCTVDGASWRFTVSLLTDLQSAAVARPCRSLAAPRDPVPPDADRHPERAALIGDGHERVAGRFVGGGDGYAGQHAARRIDDVPLRVASCAPAANGSTIRMTATRARTMDRFFTWSSRASPTRY